MLVSKIKPCMSKYKPIHTVNCEWLIISVIVYLMITSTWITVVILELIHAKQASRVSRDTLAVFIRYANSVFSVCAENRFVDS